MSDNHDLLNDKDVCSFEEHEAENVCSNKDAVACGDCDCTTQKKYVEILERKGAVVSGVIPNTAALCYVVSNATIVSFGIF